MVRLYNNPAIYKQGFVSQLTSIFTGAGF